MKKNIRRLKDCHLVEVKIAGENFILIFTNNKNVFKIEILWWSIPYYLLRELAKAWIGARNSKLNEIDRVNQALKGGLEKLT